MTTMYYLRGKVCDHCGRAPVDLPIGLSAIGWRFLWRGWHAEDYPGEELASPSQWFAYLDKHTAVGDMIVDEYEREHSLEQFRSFVEGKREKATNSRQPATDLVEGDEVSFEAFS